MRVYCRSIGNRSKHALWLEKTSFASNASGDLSGQAPNPRLVARETRCDVTLFPAAGPHGPFSFVPRPIRPSTECASSSQCQRSRAGRNGGRVEILFADHSAFVTQSAHALNESDRSHRERIGPLPSARHAVKTSRLRLWWSQTGSNRRPHACKARALPTELWPRFKTRGRPKAVVGLGGLEPPTSRLSSARSNQLSYKPG